MSPKGRPEGEYRSAQHEGSPFCLPPYAAWTRRSAGEWPRLAGELLREAGIDVALAQPGGVHVCLSPGELAQRVSALAALQAQPGFRRYDVEVLDRAELARRLPGIGPDVAGGTFCPQDGHCNPLKLLRALHAASARAGAVYRAGHGVARITPRGRGFTLDTGRGTVVAEKIVLAAGLGNAALAPMVGLAAPVRPNKGQVIALERMPRFLSLPLATIRQTDEGTVLVGDSQEDRGFDESLQLDVLAAMAARAVRVFPALAAARVVRAWAALRVMSADGFPIYQQSLTHPGAFLATCHSGVTLAAAHAYAVAPAIAAGALPESLAPYALGRFDVPKAA